MLLILIGMPGSGKGTQSELIKNRLGFNHFSVGEKLREYSKQDNEFGIKIHKLLSEGKLLPIEIVKDVVVQALKDSAGKSMILDGFPRSLEQATILSAISQDISVVFLDIKYDVLEKRILGRYICKSCGTIYNKYFAPTKIGGICDACKGTEFTYRKDDNTETLKTRVKEFQEKTEVLLSYYKDILCKIDASQSQEEIYIDIVNHLKM